MVETSATGRVFPGFGNLAEDLIPSADDTYDLGSSAKQWAALWVVLAMVTSITIGGAINLSNVGGILLINSSTEINGSLTIDDNLIVLGNLSVFGDETVFNVTTLSINGSLLPRLDNKFDIGPAILRWKDLFFSNNLFGNGSISIDGNVTADSYFGDGEFLTGIQHGALTLFLHDEASGVSGSKVLDTADNDTALVTLSELITSDGQEFQNFTTESNVPGLPILSDGVYEFHFHARVTGAGTKDTTVQFKLYKVNSTGLNPTLLITSEESNVLTTSFSQEDIHVFRNETALASDGRLTLQIVIRITDGGLNPTVEMQIENGIESRIEIPSPSPTRELFIPYTGAVKNADLGSFNLTSSFGIFSNILSTDWTNISGFLKNTGDTATLTSGNYTWNNTLFHLGQNDRVGIGTITPTHVLNVVGKSNFTANMSVGDCIVFDSGGAICSS